MNTEPTPVYPTCSGDDDLVSVGSLVERMIGVAGGAATESYQFSDAAPKGLTTKLTGPAPAARSGGMDDRFDEHFEGFRVRAGSASNARLGRAHTKNQESAPCR